MVCPCLYPLVFIDDRDGDDLSYISIPEEIFEEMGCVEVPRFEEVVEKGFDNEEHSYMAVIWKNPENATTKAYDVNDHIVIAGCQAVTDGKKLQCKKKELYMVLHPIDEWIEHHIIAISQQYEIDKQEKLKRFNRRK